MTIVGYGPGPSAAGGRVTSTSRGTPSNEGTPSTVRPGPASVVGQKRVPSDCVVQGCPNGDAAADAVAGRSAASDRASTGHQRHRLRIGLFTYTRISARQRNEDRHRAVMDHLGSCQRSPVVSNLRNGALVSMGTPGLEPATSRV